MKKFLDKYDKLPGAILVMPRSKFGKASVESVNSLKGSISVLHGRLRGQETVEPAVSSAMGSGGVAVTTLSVVHDCLGTHYKYKFGRLQPVQAHTELVSAEKRVETSDDVRVSLAFQKFQPWNFWMREERRKFLAAYIIRAIMKLSKEYHLIKPLYGKEPVSYIIGEDGCTTLLPGGVQGRLVESSVIRIGDEADDINQYKDAMRVVCECVAPELKKRSLKVLHSCSALSEASPASPAKTGGDGTAPLAFDLDDLDIPVGTDAHSVSVTEPEEETFLCEKVAHAVRLIAVYMEPRSFSDLKLIAEAHSFIVNTDLIHPVLAAALNSPLRRDFVAPLVSHHKTLTELKAEWDAQEAVELRQTFAIFSSAVTRARQAIAGFHEGITTASASLEQASSILAIFQKFAGEHILNGEIAVDAEVFFNSSLERLASHLKKLSDAYRNSIIMLVIGCELQDLIDTVRRSIRALMEVFFATQVALIIKGDLCREQGDQAVVLREFTFFGFKVQRLHQCFGRIKALTHEEADRCMALTGYLKAASTLQSDALSSGVDLSVQAFASASGIFSDWSRLKSSPEMVWADPEEKRRFEARKKEEADARAAAAAAMAPLPGPAPAPAVAHQLVALDVVPALPRVEEAVPAAIDDFDAMLFSPVFKQASHRILKVSVSGNHSKRLQAQRRNSMNNVIDFLQLVSTPSAFRDGRQHLLPAEAGDAVHNTVSWLFDIKGDDQAEQLVRLCQPISMNTTAQESHAVYVCFGDADSYWRCIARIGMYMYMYIYIYIS